MRCWQRPFHWSHLTRPSGSGCCSARRPGRWGTGGSSGRAAGDASRPTVRWEANQLTETIGAPVIPMLCVHDIQLGLERVAGHRRAFEHKACVLRQRRIEQLDGRRVGPLVVVEHEEERPWSGKLLEQRASHVGCGSAPAGASPLVPVRAQTATEDVRQLCLHVVVEGRELLGVEALDVLIERIHEDGERQLALELRRRPRRGPGALGTQRERPAP